MASGTGKKTEKHMSFHETTVDSTVSCQAYCGECGGVQVEDSGCEHNSGGDRCQSLIAYKHLTESASHRRYV